MRREKIDVSVGMKREIRSDKVDVRRLNATQSGRETNAGIAKIEREWLGGGEVDGLTGAGPCV